MTRNRETAVGGGIFIVVVLAMLYSYSGRQASGDGGLSGSYMVNATFNRVDGLFKGNDVRLGGIKIGFVEGESLDKNYRAIVAMQIDSGIELPDDTSAAIHTDGLFGSKYIVLEPGGSEEFLGNGDEITFTQDSVVVSDLLELIISQGKANRKKQDGKTEKGGL